MKFNLDSIHNSVNLSESKLGLNQIENVTAEIKSTQLNENFQDCCQSEVGNLLIDRVRNLGDFVVNSIGTNPDLYLDHESFTKSLKVMDIVTVNSTRSCCFTKK